MSIGIYTSGSIICPNCHKPTMYIGDPPGPELCDCWKKAQSPFDVYGMSQGWLCPKCGRVNAPWLGTCPCGPNIVIKTGDSTS